MISERKNQKEKETKLKGAAKPRKEREEKICTGEGCFTRAPSMTLKEVRDYPKGRATGKKKKTRKGGPGGKLTY